MKTFKVAVAGGRDFDDLRLLTEVLDNLLKAKKKNYKIVIVSGKAKGADRLGEVYANARDYEIEEYPSDWKDIDVEGAVIRENKYGKYNAAAGHLRNKQMADVCDAAVLFWDGVSSGTLNMRGLIEDNNKPLRTVMY